MGDEIMGQNKESVRKKAEEQTERLLALYSERPTDSLVRLTVARYGDTLGVTEKDDIIKMDEWDQKTSAFWDDVRETIPKEEHQEFMDRIMETLEGKGEKDLLDRMHQIDPDKEAVLRLLRSREYQDVDPEIRDLIRAINEEGYMTLGSCAGHGPKNPGFVSFPIENNDPETKKDLERIFMNHGFRVKRWESHEGFVAAKIKSLGNPYSSRKKKR